MSTRPALPARLSVEPPPPPPARRPVDNELQGLAQALRGTTPGVASRALLFGTCGVFAALVLWAAFAHVDDVTRAEGRVVPSGRIQVVQHLEGGIVASIHVKAGDEVDAAAPLVSLSPTQFGSERDSRRHQALALAARVARLEAESRGTELRLGSLATQAKAAPYIAAERAEFRGRRARMAAELATLDSQMKQRRQELDDARASLQTSERSLRLSQEERSIVAKMVDRGLEPKLELVRQDGRLSELQGRVDSGRIVIPKLEAAIDEAKARRETVVAQFRSEAASELSRAGAELSAQRELLTGLSDRVERTVVRSPVRGVVNRVLATTIGGTARPGEPLVEIVPIEDRMVVEVSIRPQDIAFVQVGQRARIRFSAYDYSIYGAWDGVVSQIGADAVQTDERQPAHYVARIETTGSAPGARGDGLPIRPGMQATVDLITGNKTVLDYLSKPIVAVKANAFRER